jgi:hypothetical protein
MDSSPANTTTTRWDVALELMNEVVSSLRQKARNDDVVSVICFDEKVQVPLERVPISDMSWCIRTLLENKNISPGGNTDMSAANAMAHVVASSDEMAARGERDIVEMFFTDGLANRGLTSSQQLYTQKSNFYSNLEKKIGSVPFLWCGAIGGMADYRNMEEMSKASPERGLWAHMTDEKLTDFAHEMGGAMAAALYARSTTLMVPTDQDFIFEEKTHWMLQDSDGYIFSLLKPRGLSCPEMECKELVDLYRIQDVLFRAQQSHRPVNKPELEKYQKELEALQNPQHDIFAQTPALLFHYETTRASVLANVEELQSQLCHFGLARMTRQLSGYRQSSQNSATVNDVKTKFEDLLNLGRNQPIVIETNPPLPGLMPPLGHDLLPPGLKPMFLSRHHQ